MRYELTRENVMHYIRISRTHDRLTDQTISSHWFDHLIHIVTPDNDFKLRENQLLVICGELEFICLRKELTQWK